MAAIVHTPHDLLAKMSLKDIAIAKDFLKAHLPTHIQKRIDFDTLILTDGEFVSPKFTKIQSDVVYSCKIDGLSGYIYVLIEHQSAPHPLMAFRKLQYEVALMDAHLKAGHKKLPVTIPLCLYHGDQSPYPYSNDVYDCFDNPELAKEVSLQPFKLINLTVMDDEQIQKHGLAALFQMLIKHHSDKSIYRLLKKLIEIHALQDTINNAKSDNYLQSVLEYIDITADVRNDRQEDIDGAIDALKAALPEQEGDIMTWTQQLENRGLAKGIQQGAQQRDLEIAKNMLRKGADLDFIIETTGLTASTVNELKSKIKH